MATLVLSAVGTLIGGPIGGSIGALLGQQVDSRIFGPGSRKGPRLKELAITTSSYGSPMPRHFGRVRAAGSIIWATDLVEQKEKHGGGKGRPKTTTYSYSSSFAVALSSRPIRGVGRIWADGNLLRGSEGDLKASGTFRLHTGEADQLPDPLIAAAEGAGNCPAFRGLAYAVFEDLELADFGNRIPTLSFELFCDEDEVSLDELVGEDLDQVDAAVALPGLAGFSVEGAVAETLVALEPIYPLDCDACGERLTFARERLQSQPVALPEAAISVADGDFGGNQGKQRRRAPPTETPAEAIRYYDVDRDYQPGLQRAPGRPGPGQPEVLEVPATLAAADARALVERAARRRGWSRETLAWRTSALDPAVSPGALVTVPGETGQWRVTEWEWRATGVELSLLRLPPAEMATAASSDPGRVNPPADLPLTPTQLVAFELPWDGTGSGETPAIFAALSSAGTGWAGAAIYVDQGNGELVSMGASGRTRATIGTVATAMPSVSPHLFDRTTSIVVQLAGADMVLSPATVAQLASGANRALVGGEMIQFASAEPLGNSEWRLSGLLRGRGGTEAAVSAHQPGENFVLLDEVPISLDSSQIGSSPTAEIVAIGLGDTAPAASAIALRGATLRPLVPVHPRSELLPDGSRRFTWTRRARGAWSWVDGVDVPLHEQAEAYQVGFGSPETPISVWETSVASLDIAATTFAQLAAAQPTGSFHVRQRGSYALSDPLLLATLA